MSEKASVWTVKNAEIQPAEKPAHKGTDVVVTFRGTITKNGELQKQKKLAVTLAQKNAGVTFAYDPTTKVATISRVEKRAGRPTSKGIAPDSVEKTLKALGFALMNTESEPEPAAR